MANPQPADVDVRYAGTSLHLAHHYLNIGLSGDENWTNAAIALLNFMQKCRKEPTMTWYYDVEFRGGEVSTSIRIGRLILDWKDMEISFDEGTKYGYDGGQHQAFEKLKDNFDRVKKIAAFL
jgi:hypothetical protein